MKEYKVVVYREGLLGTLVFGESKVDADRLADFLNGYAKDGWRVVTMEREVRRAALVSKREAFLVVLERERR